jgi:hypothetical protein
MFLLKEIPMKKFLFVLLAAALACGSAAAQEEGIGLSAGLEIGLGDVADAVEVGISPLLGYETSFLDGALDVSAEIAYTFKIADGLPMEFFAEENIGYNLPLGDISTLTFGLHHENSFLLNPFDHGDDGSVVEPNVGYALELDAGELAFALGFPITYLPEANVGAYITAGFAFPFGFGVEVTANLDLSAPGYADTNLVLSYGQETFSVELGIDAEDDTFTTFALNPLVEIYVNSLTFWAGVEIGGLGDTVSVEPFLGAKISF